MKQGRVKVSEGVLYNTAKLVIYLTPDYITPSRAEIKNRKTPRKKKSQATRVINLYEYHPHVNYGILARDICIDAGDSYYGHKILVGDRETK